MASEAQVQKRESKRAQWRMESTRWRHIYPECTTTGLDTADGGVRKVSWGGRGLDFGNGDQASLDVAFSSIDT